MLGTGGLSLSLTGTDAPPDGSQYTGAFGSEPADREVWSAPDAADLERLVTSGDRFESIETTEPAASGARLNLTIDGELLYASASRFAAGPEEPPKSPHGGKTASVTDPERARFRFLVRRGRGRGHRHPDRAGRVSTDRTPVTPNSWTAPVGTTVEKTDRFFQPCDSLSDTVRLRRSVSSSLSRQDCCSRRRQVSMAFSQ